MAEVSGSYSYSCSYFTPAPAPPLVPPQFEDLGFELTKERSIGIGYPAEISSLNKLPGGWVGHLDHDDGYDEYDHVILMTSDARYLVGQSAHGHMLKVRREMMLVMMIKKLMILRMAMS